MISSVPLPRCLAVAPAGVALLAVLPARPAAEIVPEEWKHLPATEAWSSTHQALRVLLSLRPAPGALT